jgi:hypothetical protein
MPLPKGKDFKLGHHLSFGGLWLIFGFFGLSFRLDCYLPAVIEPVFARKTWGDCGELCGFTWTEDDGFPASLIEAIADDFLRC